MTTNQPTNQATKQHCSLLWQISRILLHNLSESKILSSEIYYQIPSINVPPLQRNKLSRPHKTAHTILSVIALTKCYLTCQFFLSTSFEISVSQSYIDIFRRLRETDVCKASRSFNPSCLKEVTYHLKLLSWTESWKTFHIAFSAGTRGPIHHFACQGAGLVAESRAWRGRGVRQSGHNSSFWRKPVNLDQTGIYGLYWITLQTNRYINIFSNNESAWWLSCRRGETVSELRLPKGLLFIPRVIHGHGEPWWNDTDR
jgi:hypothetical protein